MDFFTRNGGSNNTNNENINSFLIKIALRTKTTTYVCQDDHFLLSNLFFFNLNLNNKHEFKMKASNKLMRKKKIVFIACVYFNQGFICVTKTDVVLFTPIIPLFSAHSNSSAIINLK